MADFRFENLEVWKMAIEIGHRIADLADQLEDAPRPAYTQPLREKSWIISGLLASGSATLTKRGFADHVIQARQAAMEIANLVIFYGERELISQASEAELVNMLKRESKMLDNFRQSLERADAAEEQKLEILA